MSSGLLRLGFIVLALIAIFALVAPNQFDKTKDSLLEKLGFGKDDPAPKTTTTTTTTINRTTTTNTPSKVSALNQSITIANWNLQIFGMTKAEDLDLLKAYANIIDDYDIIFVQEIRDATEIAFPRLCAFLPEYECEMSSRAGRTSSKEQYGVIYHKNMDIELVELKDYNPDSQDRWERPPIAVTFDQYGYEFVVFNIHTKPEDVENELMYLEDVADEFPQADYNTMIIGDLNADCSYYSELYEDDFDDWHWLVQDWERTNMGQIPCAYDRIILNDDMFDEYLNYGIRTSGIDNTLSDHYLVWVEIDSSVG